MILRFEKVRDLYLRGEPAKVIEAMAAIPAADIDANPEWKFLRGCANLMLGNLACCWPDYEARLRMMKPGPFTHYPKWSGESLDGKSVLIYMEQGYGDAFQFVRYARALHERGATVYVACYDCAYEFMLSNRSIRHVFAGLVPDFYVPVMSLPGLFGTTLATIPAKVPYLWPRDDLAAQWRQRIHGGGLQIGVCWTGSDAAPQRSIPAALFAGLPGTLYNLNPAAQDCPANIVDLGPQLANFSETAAAIANLDLVITCDTAIAHLAGAIAKPVWVCLPSVADWRWLLDRDDSPWYPTMRLFRRQRSGDWSEVLERVYEELQKLTEQA